MCVVVVAAAVSTIASLLLHTPFMQSAYARGGGGGGCDGVVSCLCSVFTWIKHTHSQILNTLSYSHSREEKKNNVNIKWSKHTKHVYRVTQITKTLNGVHAHALLDEMTNSTATLASLALYISTLNTYRRRSMYYVFTILLIFCVRAHHIEQPHHSKECARSERVHTHTLLIHT